MAGLFRNTAQKTEATVIFEQTFDLNGVSVDSVKTAAAEKCKELDVKLSFSGSIGEFQRKAFATGVSGRVEFASELLIITVDTIGVAVLRVMLEPKLRKAVEAFGLAFVSVR